jgi:hypothetical protein
MYQPNDEKKSWRGLESMSLYDFERMPRGLQEGDSLLAAEQLIRLSVSMLSNAEFHVKVMESVTDNRAIIAELSPLLY